MITMTVETKDGKLKKCVNVASWFRNADRDMIIDLYLLNWSSEPITDQIISYCTRPELKADQNRVELKELIEYNDKLATGQKGYDCLVSGIEAVEWLESNRPDIADVILQDMPDDISKQDYVVHSPR